MKLLKFYYYYFSGSEDPTEHAKANTTSGAVAAEFKIKTTKIIEPVSTIVCETCKKDFKNSNSLKSHITKFHNAQNNAQTQNISNETICA